MHGSDASGRRVSLLNDDEVTRATVRPPAFSWPSAQSQLYSGSESSLPNTPALLRSDSFDSQLSEAAISPLTPPGDSYYGSVRPLTYAYGREYAEGPPTKRPAYGPCSPPTSGEEDSSAATCVPERPVKRYPCRYRDLHGCEKTFTTSGHASRHSKIHTAEKAVHCQYPGCHKKFTRADNMKQHLETHYKDKTRSSSGSQRASKASLASNARRSSTASSRSMSSTTGPDSFVFWDESELRQKQTLSPTSPLSQPTRDWEPGMGGIELPLLNRPSAVGRMPSGLDTLAMAVEMDCREGRGL
ncbi:Transcriptional regulator NRG1 [Trichoderma ghanense]|uniref:Transcriptional regulator NRG1 n=1 Tax=Trichoderma ghanense TaxID=65468 RepID=A0ABY2HC31_9HYPO